ncbi:GspH/FimT family pseudopilin [Marinobacterium jannaschii]|uniref:GspH/FimT family pseudopilin n=1 Tax=Marinobacterium jannaschii TaxID=64970 RepID=UPI000684826C|nr:GspH/FimT family pseudopilin [Marinobacterium jannaschii]
MHQNGFTLVELMVVVAIAIMVTTIGIPSYSAMIADIRSRSVIYRLSNTLMKARNEAVVHQTFVSSCGLMADNRCTSNWHLGVTTFIDPNHNGQLDSGETLLQEFRQELSGSLRWRNSAPRYLQFAANGRTRFQNGSFVYCDPEKKHRRKLVVYRQGRIRIESDQDKIPVSEC